jgi:hypothetical protein
MNMLANLTTQEDIADERDSVGGGGVLDSNLYEMTIEYAYLTKSESGALALNLRLKTEDGREIRSQQWMTSGTAKGCVNYYTDRQGNKQYLPGFNMANAAALLTTGKEISQLSTEQKVINLYNSEAKAEVPTKVDMITELLGKKILVALLRQKVDKTQKNEATGAYEPTGETREENEIDKIFRASDKKTTAEIRAQAEEAAFYKAWADKWVGKVKDKTAKDATGKTGTAGAPKAAGAAGTKKPTQSLFS